MLGEYVREEVYPIMQGQDLYFTKGTIISSNSATFNNLKLSLREYENYFNMRRCENCDMIGTYRPYHFNQGDFGLYIYAEMFGMYLLSILCQTTLNLREAHTLALDSVLTHGSFHYLVERYSILVKEDIEKEDLYSAYKKKVYSQTWGTKECIEETLANAFVFKAYPRWEKGQHDYIKSFFARQRAGYSEAQDLSSVAYYQLLNDLEIMIRNQGKGRDNPPLKEFIDRNTPFRFIGLPVYLVNDCQKLEDFFRIVELLFPQI